MPARLLVMLLATAYGVKQVALRSGERDQHTLLHEQPSTASFTENSVCSNVFSFGSLLRRMQMCMLGYGFWLLQSPCLPHSPNISGLVPAHRRRCRVSLSGFVSA